MQIGSSIPTNNPSDSAGQVELLPVMQVANLSSDDAVAGTLRLQAQQSTLQCTFPKTPPARAILRDNRLVMFLQE